MKAILNDLFNRGSMYRWMCGVIFVCGLLAMLDLFGLREMSDTASAVNLVFICGATVGRSALRVRAERNTGAGSEQ